MTPRRSAGTVNGSPPPWRARSPPARSRARTSSWLAWREAPRWARPSPAPTRTAAAGRPGRRAHPSTPAGRASSWRSCTPNSRGVASPSGSRARRTRSPRTMWPASGRASSRSWRTPMGDERSFRVALVADRYVNPEPGGLDGLAVLAAAGWGVMQLPDDAYPAEVARLLLAEVAEQVEEFSRHGYVFVLIGERAGLDEALAAVGVPVPPGITPASAAELGEFLAAQ